ncbi:MAG: hypothetical protein CMJ31_06570 [Phycisphaerae bacterium]|nr:hypothetical protein [Phycisphaerae bacterium]
MLRLLEHAELVGLTNTEEFTFRAMFMAEAASSIGGLEFHTEWNSFDILIRSHDGPILIEFKYYMTRPRAGVDGVTLGYKGRAGPKNEGEFWRCVEKFATKPDAAIEQRFLVLIFARQTEISPRRSFHESYGSLSATEPIDEFWKRSVGPLEARVLRILPRSTDCFGDGTAEVERD